MRCICSDPLCHKRRKFCAACGKQHRTEGRYRNAKGCSKHELPPQKNLNKCRNACEKGGFKYCSWHVDATGDTKRCVGFYVKHNADPGACIILDNKDWQKRWDSFETCSRTLRRPFLFSPAACCDVVRQPEQTVAIVYVSQGRDGQVRRSAAKLFIKFLDFWFVRGLVVLCLQLGRSCMSSAVASATLDKPTASRAWNALWTMTTGTPASTPPFSLLDYTSHHEPGPSTSTQARRVG